MGRDVLRHVRRCLSVIVPALVVAGALTLGSSAVARAEAPESHPRLLFSGADVPALRRRVAEGGVLGAAWQRLRAKAEGVLVRVRPELVATGAYKLQNELNTYLIELGLAYQLSGDARYGRRVVDLLAALGDAGYPFWSGQDLGLGDLLEGVGLGFDWSYELMTPAERTKIVGDLTAHEMLLFDRTLLHPTNAASTYPVSNWMGVTAGGAGLALLAIEGEPGAPTGLARYLDVALEKVSTYLSVGFDAEGAGHEGLLYATYGTKNAVPFALAARRAGHGDLLATTGLRSMARWAALEQLPGQGQSFVPLNDTQRLQFGVDFAAMQFAIDPANGVAQWLWKRTVGSRGSDCYGSLAVAQAVTCDVFYLHGNVWTLLFYRPPDETPEVDPGQLGPLSVHHLSRGLVDARTGFASGANDVVSTFEARRDGIGHFQFDLGAFTLYGAGGQWAIDPGYSCVACGDTNEAGYASAHNVILVDGSQFTQATNSRYYTGQTIDDFVNAPTLSLAHADLRYAYDDTVPYAGRDHFFSRVSGRPVLLAIADQLQRDATGSHTYTWQMITASANVVVPGGPVFQILSPSGANLSGRAAAGGVAAQDPAFGVAAKVLTNNPPLGEGAALVLSATTAPQPALDQLTVMALTPPGRAAATTATLRVSGGNAIEVEWDGASDVVVRRLANADEVSGAIATNGTFAKFARGGGETIVRDGTRLTADGHDYVRVTGTNAITIVGGDAAQSAGDATNRYRVFAPQPIRTVRVNGAAASWCRQSQEIVFPCPDGHVEPIAAQLTAEPALLRVVPLALPLFRVQATLTRRDTGRPLSDQLVSFSAGGPTELCSAVTDITGTASCSAAATPTPILLSGQYTASYHGTADVAPASATGPIVR